MSALTLSLRSFPVLPLKCARPLSTTPWLLSGHNKWSKIKHTKGAMDAQKSAIYARLQRDIILAIRETGNTNAEMNASLAAAIKRAKSNGVPKDSIEKAIQKASGSKGGGDQAVTYEAMGPGSVGIVIECLTNNVNRAFKFTRETLAKHGGRLAPVAFLFQRRGEVRVALEQGEDFDTRLERLVETALEAEADDFEQDEPEDGVVEIEFTCQPASVARLTAAVTAPGLCKELMSSEIVYTALEKPEVVDEETETKIENLVEALEALEDTLRVTTTLN